MREVRVDVAVVGAGTAGLYAMARVLERTDSAVLFEGGREGTMCARAGCMPSKALIHAARCVRDVHGPGAAGLPPSGGAMDYARIMAGVREKRDTLVSRTAARPRKRFGEKIVKEYASFVEPMVLSAGGVRYLCKSIVLAPGSLPVVPPGWLLVPERIVTTEEFFDLPTLPREVLVVGMGPVGLELSQAMALLGPSVTAVEMGETAAGVQDPEVLSTLKQALLETPNFQYHFRSRAALRSAGERVAVEMEDLEGGARWETAYDLVLLAVGRAPALSRLSLENAGIELDPKGRPVVDGKTLQCPGQNVFMAGDASALRPFFHDAADQGRLAGANAAAAVAGEKPAPAKPKAPLAIVFTEPNVAATGLSWKDFSQDAHVAGTADVRSSGRCFLEDREHAIVRLYAEKATGKLAGAELCAPHGEHLGHFLALAIQTGFTIDQMLDLPYYHPTYEELLPTALLDAKKKME
ncbi:MAG: dihydrolipoyl dehydrogenase [Proteobacteria bacterium]|nr:dihydrolipoyl dehydrogenase [Pseudomonadota bacterium]